MSLPGPEHVIGLVVGGPDDGTTFIDLPQFADVYNDDYQRIEVGLPDSIPPNVRFYRPSPRQRWDELTPEPYVKRWQEYQQGAIEASSEEVQAAFLDRQAGRRLTPRRQLIVDHLSERKLE